MQIRIFSDADITTAVPIPKAIDVMQPAYSQLSVGQAILPLRPQISTLIGIALFMPTYLQ